MQLQTDLRSDQGMDLDAARSFLKDQAGPTDGVSAFFSNAAVSGNGVEISTDAELSAGWDPLAQRVICITELHGQLNRESSGMLGTLDEAQTWLRAVTTEESAYRGYFGDGVVTHGDVTVSAFAEITTAWDFHTGRATSKTILQDQLKRTSDGDLGTLELAQAWLLAASTEESTYSGFFGDGSIAHDGITVSADANLGTEWDFQAGHAVCLTNLHNQLNHSSDGQLGTVADARRWLDGITTEQVRYEGFFGNAHVDHEGTAVDGDVTLATAWNAQSGGPVSLTTFHGLPENGRLDTSSGAQSWLQSLATPTASYRAYLQSVPQTKILQSNSFQGNFDVTAQNQ